MEKKHHFLYYIFQFDQKRCKMEAKKENKLKMIVQEMICLRNRGA